MYVHQCISCMNKNILEKSKIFYKNIILLNVFYWYCFRFIVLCCFIFFYCFNVFCFLIFFYFWWFTGVCLWGLPQAFLDSIKQNTYKKNVKQTTKNVKQIQKMTNKMTRAGNPWRFWTFQLGFGSSHPHHRMRKRQENLTRTRQTKTQEDDNTNDSDKQNHNITKNTNKWQMTPQKSI